ncbi:hypothetical protein E2562_021014 [Oryza meyeriana var. granulata]|uniref:Uncharacterized protein n=1 Tax=Oryza meyeriana var. granulata TaxID=110450 RepID=A0A6G1FAR3_9ORYZ|nr:hypothetical protein E2562_021014 [Oryza meyeriana var. granulata]
MLRRGLPSGRKLAMDLHLLLHRGKIAGKALGDLVTFHHHGHGGGHRHRVGAFSSAGSSLSCRAFDPALAVYEPSRGRREVEVFEMLNDSEHLFNDDDGDALAVAPVTAETPLWTPARSRSPAPAMSRAARITDSPYAANNGDDSASAGGGQQLVDRKADEFIRRFYEQLRAQRSVAATPDYYGGRTPRPVAAGIA